MNPISGHNALRVHHLSQQSCYLCNYLSPLSFSHITYSAGILEGKRDLSLSPW